MWKALKAPMDGCGPVCKFSVLAIVPDESYPAGGSEHRWSPQGPIGKYQHMPLSSNMDEGVVPPYLFGLCVHGCIDDEIRLSVPLSCSPGHRVLPILRRESPTGKDLVQGGSHSAEHGPEGILLERYCSIQEPGQHLAIHDTTETSALPAPADVIRVHLQQRHDQWRRLLLRGSSCAARLRRWLQRDHREAPVL